MFKSHMIYVDLLSRYQGTYLVQQVVNEVREVGNGLFLAIRLSKRIKCVNSIHQNCRCHFVHWQQKMNGDFDEYVIFNCANIDTVNNNGDNVGFHSSLSNEIYIYQILIDDEF